MLTDLIAHLRPAGNSSADYAAAISRCDAAQGEADAAVAAAEQDWQAGLLDSDLAGLAAKERKLHDAKTAAAATAARVAAVRSQLEARMVAAKAEEAQQRVNDARGHVEDIGAARTAWWDRHRETLAAILREGEQIDTAYGTAQQGFVFVRRIVEGAYPDADLSYPAATGAGSDRWRDKVELMARPVPPPVLLPSAEERAEQKAAEAAKDAAGAEWAKTLPAWKHA